MFFLSIIIIFLVRDLIEKLWVRWTNDFLNLSASVFVLVVYVDKYRCGIGGGGGDDDTKSSGFFHSHKNLLSNTGKKIFFYSFPKKFYLIIIFLFFN
ncbi:hypothetical protein DERF_001584 [Dermatophagoides farinae]|uniref:Uncharacterized protein n=1 Tax=Dermatophagoides farinae TaxID=6954 RepID=A0A922L8T2_DERFA|nr:hypothetical protein DERF_001584 [Dermatophagoides farinae]